MISATTHLLTPKSLSLAHTLPLRPRSVFFICLPGTSTWRFHKTLNAVDLKGESLLSSPDFLFHFVLMKSTICCPSSRYDMLGTLMPPFSLSPFIRSQILSSLLPKFLNLSGLPSCFCPHCLSLDPHYFLASSMPLSPHCPPFVQLCPLLPPYFQIPYSTEIFECLLHLTYM